MIFVHLSFKVFLYKGDLGFMTNNNNETGFGVCFMKASLSTYEDCIES